MGESDKTGETWLTSREVAALYRVDRATVNRWAREWLVTGEVKVTRTGTGPLGNFRFLAADIQRIRAPNDWPAAPGGVLPAARNPAR